MELLARIPTTRAGDWLDGLVELWTHTYPVRHDALTAEVFLPAVQAVMTADSEDLTIRLVGDSQNDVGEAREIVERHLRRVLEEREEECRPEVRWTEI